MKTTLKLQVQKSHSIFALLTYEADNLGHGDNKSSSVRKDAASMASWRVGFVLNWPLVQE